MRRGGEISCRCDFVSSPRVSPLVCFVLRSHGLCGSTPLVSGRFLRCSPAFLVSRGTAPAANASGGACVLDPCCTEDDSDRILSLTCGGGTNQRRQWGGDASASDRFPSHSQCRRTAAALAVPGALGARGTVLDRVAVAVRARVDELCVASHEQHEKHSGCGDRSMAADPQR